MDCFWTEVKGINRSLQILSSYIVQPLNQMSTSGIPINADGRVDTSGKDVTGPKMTYFAMF